MEKLGIPPTRETRYRKGPVSGRFYVIPLDRQRAYRAHRGGQAAEIATGPSGLGSLNTQASRPLARQS